MDWAIHEISLLLGSIISNRELHIRIKNATRVLFPSCQAAELIIRDKREPTVECPKEVVLREIRKIIDGNIVIKELPSDYAEHVIDVLSDRPGQRILSSNGGSNRQLISFYLDPPKTFKDQFALFIMVAANLPHLAFQRAQILKEQLSVTLDRTERLEQLTWAANPSKPDFRSSQTESSQNAWDLDGLKTTIRKSFVDFFETLFEVEFAQLQEKIMNYIYEETNAETGFLIMQMPNATEFVCHYVGKTMLDQPLCINLDEKLFSCSVNSQETIYTSNVPPEYGETIRNILQVSWQESSTDGNQSDAHNSKRPQLKSMICCPIPSYESDTPAAIVVLVNKREMIQPSVTDVQFAIRDEKVIRTCMRYALPLMRCALAYQNERLIKSRTEEMLKVAGTIFTHMMNLTDLLLKIMQEARNLTKAERCSVFLVEEETNTLVAKVLDGLPTSPSKNTTFVTPEGETLTLPEEIRIALNQGIAGRVATTGEILNIKDAYSHPLFYRGVDEQTGFRTRNILCFPIKNERNGIVGVAQLCNKIGFPYFMQADEDVAKTFSVYCCISIVHSLMYKKVQDAQHRTRLANELMMYHMQVSEKKVTWLSTCEIPPLEKIMPIPTSFASIPRDITSEESSLLAILSMFEDLGLIKQWRLSRKTLARFTLMVRRGYRDPAYHNWMHAFSVCHFVYVCGKNLPLCGQLLTEMEFLALFVASLCHDIDHRGTNNTFQLQSQSLLATLYSSEGSVLERHHFSQTICILNTSGCNIFESLTESEYSQMLDLIRDIILSTDLVHHLNIFPKQQRMVCTGYDKTNETHHSLLLALLMTAADLSDQTKQWRNTVTVAKLIYEEFFRQGDLEKALGHSPMDSMDRERACVPQLQISFLDLIITPLYEVFMDIFPEASDFLKVVRENRHHWKCLLDRVKRGLMNGNGLQIFSHDLTDDQYFTPTE